MDSESQPAEFTAVGSNTESNVVQQSETVLVSSLFVDPSTEIADSEVVLLNRDVIRNCDVPVTVSPIEFSDVNSIEPENIYDVKGIHLKLVTRKCCANCYLSCYFL